MSSVVNVLHILFSIPILLGFVLFAILMFSSVIYALSSEGIFVYERIKNSIQFYLDKTMIQNISYHYFNKNFNHNAAHACACRFDRNGRVHLFTKLTGDHDCWSHHFSGHSLNEAVHLLKVSDARNSICSQKCEEGKCKGARHCPLVNKKGTKSRAQLIYNV